MWLNRIDKIMVARLHPRKTNSPGLSMHNLKQGWQVWKCGLMWTKTHRDRTSTYPWHPSLSTDALVKCNPLSCTRGEVNLVAHLCLDLLDISGHHPVVWNISDSPGPLYPDCCFNFKQDSHNVCARLCYASHACAVRTLHLATSIEDHSWLERRSVKALRGQNLRNK